MNPNSGRFICPICGSTGYSRLGFGTSIRIEKQDKLDDQRYLYVCNRCSGVFADIDKAATAAHDSESRREEGNLYLERMIRGHDSNDD